MRKDVIHDEAGHATLLPTWNRNMSTLTIHLNHLPDRVLSPNARKHWRTVAKAKRDAKAETYYLCREAGIPEHPFEKATISVTFKVDNRRRRDIDNLFAALKPYIDGLVVAGVLVDDSADRVRYVINELVVGDVMDTVLEVDAEGGREFANAPLVGGG